MSERAIGMGGHQSGVMDSDEWLTPPEIIQSLGVFDLDPCAPLSRPWDTASCHFSKLDDGLSKPWHGRVWCNPPYGRETHQWLTKLSRHGQGTALIFARTETRMFFETVWSEATAVLFLKGRLHFHRVDGERARANSGAPSVLVAYGEKDAQALRVCSVPGFFMSLSSERI